MSDTPETPKLPPIHQMSEISEPKESQENRHKLTRTEWVLRCTVLILLVIIGCLVFGINFSRRKIQANEGYVIAILRNMPMGQEGHHGGCGPCYIDQDSDGTGEYALLGEMAGTIPCRSTYGGPLRPRGDPVTVNPALGPKNRDPWGINNGYHFQIFLAGKKRCTTDHGTTDPVPLNPDDQEEAAIINVQETKWRCYAWPISRFHGTRCFAIDQQAEVLAAPNTTTIGKETVLIYQGDQRTPRHDAAAEFADQPETMEANFNSGTGQDKQTWGPAGS